MRELQVKTQSGVTKIYIGEKVIQTRLPALIAGQKNFVVTDSNVYALYADFFKEYFSSAEIYILNAGEENKNFQSLYAILEKMTGAGIYRTSKLFAVGGGVVGDIAGLAAALYMRGIPCVQIPTTLLAQVDSSVGGKTAIDFKGVKNLVGAFYSPVEVLISPTFLNTLHAREMKCGFGEVVKYAALSGEIFELLEAQENLQEKLKDIDFLKSIIEACVQYKASVVEADERDKNERKALNLGHTTGHAIELAGGLSHGESVLVGMFLETKIAMLCGVCERAYGEKLLRLISRALALEPVCEDGYKHAVTYAENAKVDKKNENGETITMSVAKSKGEWALLSLPFARYKTLLQELGDEQ